MQELDDKTLLREYVEHNSEEAFATLVMRHVNKVYSVALRHTGNPHQAEEITQAVFVILARKSNRLAKRVILEGWLYQTARLTALTFIRSEIRRTRREQEAHMQTILNENEPDIWRQIAPLLDKGMASFNETDRHAIVLRFFYGKSMKEIGTALGASEGAATVRLHRAEDKLRQFFNKRGISSTADIIAGAISANSVQSAPPALAKSITAIALTKGATASSSTLTLIKGVLKLMALSKAKTAIVIGVGVLVATAIATVVVEKGITHSNSTQITTESFKKYLESQPPAKHVVFLYRQAKETNGAWVLPDHFKVFAGGWSKDGYYERDLRTPGEPESKMTKGAPLTYFFAGRSGTNYWEIAGTGVTYSRSQIPDEKGLTTDPIISFSRIVEVEVRNVLDMGLDNAAYHSIQWKGNHFVATFEDKRVGHMTIRIKDLTTGKIRPPEDPAHLFGELLSSNGTPSELHIRRFDNQMPLRVVKYFYTGSNSLPMGLPDRIVTSAETEHGLTPISETIILSLEFLKEGATEYFDPVDFVDSRYRTDNFYSNRAAYFLKNGVLVKEPAPRR